ncbi:MAG: hypothetical protein R2710_30265 [Acidimicrobiales bacterium]
MTAAAAVDMDVLDAPVVGNGRVELLHYLREQAISRTLHRFGNLVALPEAVCCMRKWVLDPYTPGVGTRRTTAGRRSEAERA